jgi:sugar O-acyltransferase (sialic acid O-acetyltransferase NeuD family)
VRPLLLVGAGGFGREAAQAVAALNEERPAWGPVGFLDDRPELRGTCVEGVPVVGAVADAARHPDAALVVCTGNPRDYSSRRRIVERLGLPPERYATLVHPAASVARTAEVGRGCALLAHVAVTAHAVLGAHVVVMPGVVVTHDDVVGDYATLAAGVRLGGGVEVGAGAYLGAGALVREGLRVGEGSLLGMGSVLLRDVPPNEVWAGAPARRISPSPLAGERERAEQG